MLIITIILIIIIYLMFAIELLIYLLPIYLIIKSLISKVELPFKYKFLYFFEKVKKFMFFSISIKMFHIFIEINFIENLLSENLYVYIDIFFIVFYLTIYLVNKNTQNKIKNYINKLESKKWNLTKEEIKERFNYMKNTEILEEEKEELEMINQSKIFNNNLYAYIGCKNINQIYLYLSKKYGKYQENWDINFLEINENKLTIILNNQEIIFYKI